MVKLVHTIIICDYSPIYPVIFDSHDKCDDRQYVKYCVSKNRKFGYCRSVCAKESHSITAQRRNGKQVENSRSYYCSCTYIILRHEYPDNTGE